MGRRVLTGVAALGWAVLVGCTQPRPWVRLEDMQEGTDLRVEVYRHEGQVKVGAQTRGGWIQSLTLWNSSGVAYRPVSVERTAPMSGGPRLSVGIGGTLTGERRTEEGGECRDETKEGGRPGLGFGLSVPMEAGGDSVDHKTFTFEVSQEKGPEQGGWRLSCEVTTNRGSKREFRFDVPGVIEGTKQAGPVSKAGAPPDEEEDAGAVPTQVCLAIFLLREPEDGRLERQFSPLPEDHPRKRQIRDMVALASRMWGRARIAFEICGIYEIDPEQAVLPEGEHRLSDYRNGDGEYETERRIDDQDFLLAASRYVDSANLRCPLGNRACLKLFIASCIAPVGQHGAGSAVGLDQVVAPHPTALAHELGHQLMGVVEGRTDSHGHVDDPGNLMYPRIDGAPSGIEDWQKERALHEIQERGLQVPPHPEENRPR